MPGESAKALLMFTSMNPTWRGAHWDDVLDVLMDSDSHLDVIEPIIEALPLMDARLVRAVVLTALYADPSSFNDEWSLQERVTAVAATITNNGG